MPLSTEDILIGDVDQMNARIGRQRRIQITGLVIVVLFALLALISRFTGGVLLGLSFVFWVTIAAVLLLAKIIYLIAVWRCPRCRGMLGPGYHPRYCSNCGQEFTSSRTR
jgi:hypothetical protein